MRLLEPLPLPLPLALALLALAASCVQADELGPTADGAASLPIFATAEDFAAITTASVSPCNGLVSAPLSFNTAGQVYGVAVALPDGGSLDIETQGDVTLDTIVAVYGPDDGSRNFGTLPLTVDDASGPGQLSQILGLIVPEPGRSRRVW